MKLSEIDAKIAELEKLRVEAIAKEKEAELAKGFDEAKQIIGDLVPTLNRLNELGYMPPRLAQALADSSGKWNPGMFIKRPKAPR